MRSLITGTIVVAMAIGCGGSTEQTVVTAPPVKPDNTDYQPSVDERCPVLRDCYADLAADDCPERPVLFTSASTELDKRSKRLLSEVVSELSNVKTIGKLQLTGYALKTEPPYVAGARADAVKKWLIERGVDAALLDTSTVTAATSRGQVRLDAQKCTGQREERDGDGTAAAPFLLF